MPELPEVETIKNQLKKEIVGQTIVEVWFDRPKMLRPSAAVFVADVVKKILYDVSRRAKLLIFELGRGAGGAKSYLICHLKLSGRLLVREKNDPPDDYVHVILKFKGDKELRFAEARLFGFMQYVTDQKELARILGKYGPEPLDDLDEEKFYAILQRTAKPIKVALMDQNRISGIGNIYANDALYLAQIHPATPANKLSREQAVRLLESLKEVLNEGLKYGGASDQWYRQVHGEKGSYQKHFKVYGREGEECGRCGAVIRRIEVGGRGTFYCPGCQKK